MKLLQKLRVWRMREKLRKARTQEDFWRRCETAINCACTEDPRDQGEWEKEALAQARNEHSRCRTALAKLEAKLRGASVEARALAEGAKIYPQTGGPYQVEFDESAQYLQYKIFARTPLITPAENPWNDVFVRPGPEKRILIMGGTVVIGGMPNRKWLCWMVDQLNKAD